MHDVASYWVILDIECGVADERRDVRGWTGGIERFMSERNQETNTDVITLVGRRLLQ